MSVSAVPHRPTRRFSGWRSAWPTGFTFLRAVQGLLGRLFFQLCMRFSERCALPGYGSRASLVTRGEPGASVSAAESLLRQGMTSVKIGSRYFRLVLEFLEAGLSGHSWQQVGSFLSTVFIGLFFFWDLFFPLLLVFVTTFKQFGLGLPYLWHYGRETLC